MLIKIENAWVKLEIVDIRYVEGILYISRPAYLDLIHQAKAFTTF